MIPSLDLFSGIGGFAYALRDIAKPVAYCEIDPFAQDILRRNVRYGRLPEAPIHDDVRTMVPPPDDCRILTAGFPCQDISALNRNPQGLDGDRSGLFREIIRLLRDSPGIQVVCLENSPSIIQHGLRTVLHEMKQLGFNIAWGIFAASEVGAPHRRRRWFSLAYRNRDRVECGDILDRMSCLIDTRSEAVDWGEEPCTRMIPFESHTTKRIRKKELYALGNAIVPRQAAKAIKTLARMSTTAHSPSKVRALDDIRATMRHVYIMRAIDGAIVVQKRRYRLHAIEYEPLIFESPTIRIVKTLWPTPTANQETSIRRLTSRLCKFFKIAIYYEIKTRTQMCIVIQDVEFANHRWMINPAFVAWMMGYELDWCV
jgi:site-specific DNA-cytosine methylase